MPPQTCRVLAVAHVDRHCHIRRIAVEDTDVFTDHPTQPPGKDRCLMGITSWPPEAQTDLTVPVATDGLAGVYDATVRLGRAELFHDGWQPTLDPTTARTLLADLAGLGDEPAQLVALGWTLRPAADGQIALIEANLPAQSLEQVDGRFRLPRECGFTVVGDLPPLAQLYRSLTLLEAYAYGPTDQLVESDELLAQARTAGQALGDILGALYGLALDTDADTVRAVVTSQSSQIGAAGVEPAATTPQPVTAEYATPVDADVTACIQSVHRELVAAAADMVTAYLPTAAR
jgi:hypothetical protein